MTWISGTNDKVHTEWQRSDIEQENVCDVASEDTTLDRSTNSDSFIRVDALTWHAAKNALNCFCYPRHMSHATDQNNLIDFTGLDTGVGQCLLAQVDSVLDQRSDQHLKLWLQKLQVYMPGTRCVSSDEGEIDFNLWYWWQLNLGLLGCLMNALDCHMITAEIKATLLLEFSQQMVDQHNVEVFTTQVCHCW